jgi:hypothetical protein
MDVVLVSVRCCPKMLKETDIKAFQRLLDSYFKTTYSATPEPQSLTSGHPSSEQLSLLTSSSNDPAYPLYLVTQLPPLPPASLNHLIKPLM